MIGSVRFSWFYNFFGSVFYVCRGAFILSLLFLSGLFRLVWFWFLSFVCLLGVGVLKCFEGFWFV